MSRYFSIQKEKMFNNNEAAEEAVETLTIREYINYKGKISAFYAWRGSNIHIYIGWFNQGSNVRDNEVLKTNITEQHFT
jgi:hypothetical protein